MRNDTTRFASNPASVNIKRSKFSKNTSRKLSANAGEIIPFYVDEILPGDTFQIRTNLLARLQTLVAPIMDNVYLDTYYFFVPNRLLWSHWKEFQGENTESKWIPSTEYTIPQLVSPASTGWATGTIADHLGVPVGVPDLSVNALPFRAYAMICNEWFRDENNLDYLDIPSGDSTVVGVNTDTFVTDVAKGGKPYLACKLHDYFTTCLPYPQKGPDVGIGLSGDIPIVGNGYALGFSDGTFNRGGIGTNNGYLGLDVAAFGTEIGETHSSASGSYKSMGIATADELGDDLYKSGLVGSLGSSSAITINALRLAIATQKMYELDSRGGSRYIEQIRAHFGVVSPDARQQRPEYLGGQRIPINVNQVVQTSGDTVGGTPQGNVAGYSVTSDSHGDFIKSFTEHGYILGLCVLRYHHTYQQGLSKMWSRKSRTDFYLPVFANLGEQPVFNKEIFCDGSSADDEVFGYQEAWAEYRYMPNSVTGEMRSQYATSLDVWHLADDYASLPVLQSDWIQEDKSNLDRVLQVSSSVSNQYFVDFYLQVEATRPMPLYSIPGGRL